MLTLLNISGLEFWKIKKTSLAKLASQLYLGLSDRLKAFRFNKSEHNRALILKVDPVRKVVVADGDEHENIDIDELRDELPERQPRFVILTYK